MWVIETERERERGKKGEKDSVGNANWREKLSTVGLLIKVRQALDQAIKFQLSNALSGFARLSKKF